MTVGKGDCAQATAYLPNDSFPHRATQPRGTAVGHARNGICQQVSIASLRQRSHLHTGIADGIQSLSQANGLQSNPTVYKANKRRSVVEAVKQKDTMSAPQRKSTAGRRVTGAEHREMHKPPGPNINTSTMSQTDEATARGPKRALQHGIHALRTSTSPCSVQNRSVVSRDEDAKTKG